VAPGHGHWLSNNLIVCNFLRLFALISAEGNHGGVVVNSLVFYSEWQVLSCFRSHPPFFILQKLFQQPVSSTGFFWFDALNTFHMIYTTHLQMKKKTIFARSFEIGDYFLQEKAVKMFFPLKKKKLDKKITKQTSSCIPKLSDKKKQSRLLASLR